MFKEAINRIKHPNPFELFVSILAISVLVFVVKFFGIKEDYRYIRVEVIRKNWTENYDPYGYRAPFWLSDKIKVGQTEKNSVGKNIAELVRLENYIRGGEESELYLTLKIKAVLNRRTGRYTYKDKPMDLGSQIELNLGTANILGQIVDDNTPLTGYPTKYVQVKMRGRNMDPALYSKITPGLKMYDRANNEAIAELTDVKIEDSSLQPVTFEGGRYLYQNRNQNKDVIITAKIKVFELDNRWYFSGHQNVIHNSSLWFYTDSVYIYGLTIEEINEQ